MTCNNLNILFIDDDEDEHFLINELFSEIMAAENNTLNIFQCYCYEDAVRHLKDNDMDLCLIDFRLGAKDGLELVDDFVGLGCKFPFILLTGQGERSIEELAMVRGVADYLVKSKIDAEALWRSIRYTLQRKKQEEESTQLQMQLFHSEKLASVGQLSAGIAHEINTPIQYVGDNMHFLDDMFKEIVLIMGKLNSIVNTAEGGVIPLNDIKQLKQELSDIDVDYLCSEIPTAIEQSLEGISHVSMIVRAMREFSHPGAKEKTSIDINQAINTTVTVARNEWKYVADISLELQSEIPPVSCYPNELNQVLLNLIINASHAIEQKIKDGNENEKGRIIIRTRSLDDRVEIQIEDSGAGIPDEIQNKIYDPFFTTKVVGKGTGQGLSVAYANIVDKHKGQITFNTKQGEGTTFILSIPMQ